MQPCVRERDAMHRIFLRVLMVWVVDHDYSVGVVHGKGTKGQMEKEETGLKNWWWWWWWWCKLRSGVRYKTLKDRETKCSGMAGLERI